MRQKKGHMLIKLDLENAYDRVNESFLHDTLQVIGFPPSWINLIMNCINSNEMV